jgi:hypothetical protein
MQEIKKYVIRNTIMEKEIMIMTTMIITMLKEEESEDSLPNDNS